MTSTISLTDRRALKRNRRRALRQPEFFLHDIAAEELQDRLSMVNKTFTAPAVVSGFPEYWSRVFPEARIVADEATLDVREGAHDLLIHTMCLHWADDPVGQLIQARRALKPDGLFLAVLFGGSTLNELRSALTQAESEVSGGLSPRVAPMAELRDLGGLLQRAGYALPVVDSLPLKTSYETPLHLMRELRAMGETNALSARHRVPIRHELLTRSNEIYAAEFGESDGRVIATFELIFLIGWAPAPGQQQPLRPGSATTRLSDALGVKETPLED